MGRPQHLDAGMLTFRPEFPKGRAPILLFIGAHCDDIEIGCGGTVLELIRRYPRAVVHWLVLSSDARREAEARRSAGLFLKGAGRSAIIVKSFRNSYFPTDAAAIKDCFEELKSTVSPDIVFTHYRDDLHQDHRIAGELTWNTFRNHPILEYEIPKYDGGLGSPSAFIPLRSVQVRRKIEILMKVFGTQRNKQWFSPETFQGLMRLRGIECNAPDGYAEAFYARKLVL